MHTRAARKCILQLYAKSLSWLAREISRRAKEASVKAGLTEGNPKRKAGGKAGKAGKGGHGKGTGKSRFQGNCHNSGTCGHRTQDCPEPRQKQGVGYAADQPVAVMVTGVEDTQVDYRAHWTHV